MQNKNHLISEYANMQINGSKLFKKHQFKIQLQLFKLQIQFIDKIKSSEQKLNKIHLKKLNKIRLKKLKIV